MMMAVVTIVGRWGTWEELLLAGTVLRHGTGDWNVVAGELRARALCPETFTPEACKAKFEDLQQRYSGCKVWFEVLKKKRMAELRAALEQSQDSIGSLESKLESLKAERKDECQNDYDDSSQTVSLEPSQKSEGVECTGKDTSKDLSSVGSFTHQAQINWSPSPEPKKLEVSASEQDKNLCKDKVAETLQVVPSIRKRRGKRKRKDCSKDVKEASVGESDLLASCASGSKETSTSNHGIDGKSQGHGLVEPDDLMRIYNCVAESDCASVFRRRLDSQKRGRFKKLVRRHMDFDTIKSRISCRSISSSKELFRDLLLVSNNALIFYSKNTREYKSAWRLRDIITKSLKQHLREDHCIRNPVVSTFSPTKRPAKKPRSLRPPKKPSEKTAAALHDVIKTPNGGKRTFGTDSPPSVESLAAVKKVTSGRRKVGGRCMSQRPDSTASRGRKRTEVR